MRRFTVFVAVLALLVLSASVCRKCRSHSAYAAEQTGNWSTGPCSGDEGNTHNHSWFGHQERVCELRTTTIKLGGSHLNVKSENGGIEITGEDRSDVVIEARIQAWAGSEGDARNILKQVAIETSGDSIRDNGPHFHLGDTGYGVNYRIRAPRKLAVDLKSENGGIDIAHLEGDIHFDTTNGGVDLDDLAGDVHGSTVNGGLDIALTGDRWRGKGLSAETTNGGLSLKIPEHYSAHLETGTVNGGIEVNFPITVQGEIKNRLSADLGGGGPTIHAETTNGGVEINRASAN
jgi:DUF4097 and DUF4098 domain-containing protein YvlB